MEQEASWARTRLLQSAAPCLNSQVVFFFSAASHPLDRQTDGQTVDRRTDRLTGWQPSRIGRLFAT